ncbi:MAG: hypothetical protein WBA20_02850 [Ketobacter sp.]|nr:MAG: hypothetical protein D6160_03455 [Ketobacter sp.]
MKKETLDELIACLPDDRTLFHYFKGQYAFLLLACAIREEQSINQLKKSPYQSLLKQPDIKKILARQGDGKVSAGLFKHPWRNDSQPFVLTVDTWGKHNQWQYQTTRKGCNLVLQLNFSEHHNRAYQRLVKPKEDYLFNYSGHPVMDREKRRLYRETLAWARIDLDLESNEALIEEIQSDWVRRARYCLQGIRKGDTPWYLDWCHCEPEAFVRYAENVLAPYNNIWPEAMLSAAIEFIHSELGICNIFYHTHECGGKVKQIRRDAPPRSLYSDLPKKFCFQITDKDPRFISDDRFYVRKKRHLKKINWYKLEL